MPSVTKPGEEIDEDYADGEEFDIVTDQVEPGVSYWTEAATMQDGTGLETDQSTGQPTTNQIYLQTTTNQYATEKTTNHNTRQTTSINQNTAQTTNSPNTAKTTTDQNNAETTTSKINIQITSNLNNGQTNNNQNTGQTTANQQIVHKTTNENIGQTTYNETTLVRSLGRKIAPNSDTHYVTHNFKKNGERGGGCDSTITSLRINSDPHSPPLYLS